MTTTTTGCKGVKDLAGKHTRCDKVTAPGSLLCPRCAVLADHYSQEPARRVERTRAFKAANIAAEQQEAEFLASSPLRGFNPEFDAPSRR
jgi:hypothetical protein